ncbi:MAG: cell division protein ZapE [Alphaproteobacteria bacterium]|nr:cell division protein ZapE [Alphaproteobacteria bacterium]
MHPAERYRALVAEKKLTGDRAQERVSAALEALATKLETPGRKSLFGFRRAAPPPRGLYIHGPVGRGKSMLMDLFYENVAVVPKRRVHFHDFMADVHVAVKHWRQEDPGNEIVRTAEGIRTNAALLCFDEFQVQDIADAMILARLFEALFEADIVVVATSNRHPRALYENGINRQLFLPAIGLIEKHMDVMHLDGPIDYRLAHLERARVYFTPLSAEATGALDAVWHDLTGTAKGEPSELEVLGRKLKVPELARGAARFTFDELCVAALGPQDFLAIADAFHAIVVKDIPLLTAEKRNEAKRFVTLIDALYERSAKLICTAAAPPADLYRAGDGSFEFERTASRLVEMQTPEYLGRSHKPKLKET